MSLKAMKTLLFFFLEVILKTRVCALSDLKHLVIASVFKFDKEVELIFLNIT